MTSVDLVVPELGEHDATSVHTRQLRRLLEDDGHRVRLVVELPVTTGEEAVPLRRWRADADVTVLQHAIGSVAADEIVRRRVPVVVNYHNVTPPEFVEPWDPGQLAGLRWGRDQLWQLAPLTRLAVGVSEFNARDLRTVGMDPVEVAPVLFDRAAMPPPDWAPDAAEPSAAGGGGGGSAVPSAAKTLLFVGRLAPNKCQQELVAVLAAVREMLAAAAGEGGGGSAVPSAAELVLVGGVSSVGFGAAVEGLVGELGLGEVVTLAGSVSDEELAGWYRRADVFVCVSEHEGFCVPLVEAMAWGVPVVAFGAAAVPETVGGAGLVLAEKSVVGVASAVVRVLSDVGLRERLVAAGRVRAAELGHSAAVARWREVLGPVLAATPERTP